MSWTNTHRRPSKAQTLVWAVTGIGIGVLASRGRPAWQKTVRKAVKLKNKVQDATHVVRRPSETDLEEMVSEVSFNFGGPLDEKGRKQVDAALVELTRRLVGVQLDEG